MPARTSRRGRRRQACPGCGVHRSIEFIAKKGHERGRIGEILAAQPESRRTVVLTEVVPVCGLLEVANRASDNELGCRRQKQNPKENFQVSRGRLRICRDDRVHSALSLILDEFRLAAQTPLHYSQQDAREPRKQNDSRMEIGSMKGEPENNCNDPVLVAKVAWFVLGAGAKGTIAVLGESQKFQEIKQ